MIHIQLAKIGEYFQSIKNREESGVMERTSLVDKVSIPTSEISSLNTVSPSRFTQSSHSISAQSNDTNIALGSNDTPEILSGISAKIAANMSNSLHVPTATSFRVLPVKALEENRNLINRYHERNLKRKVSYTHILAWAIVKGLVKYPHMNDAFTMKDGIPHSIKHASINIGLAIDITRKDGMRMLVVPSIKHAQNLSFSEFCSEYDSLISKARNNKLSVDEMTGATVSLTNPGTIGTISSVPRLMEGQGLIIAAGSIDYPAEFQAVMPDVLSTLAISKVVTVTSTYDHRIIQGAESGEFLAYLHKLMIGEEYFMIKSLHNYISLLNPCDGPKIIELILLCHRMNLRN